MARALDRRGGGGWLRDHLASLALRSRNGKNQSGTLGGQNGRYGHCFSPQFSLIPSPQS
jgi:hypothetical protein